MTTDMTSLPTATLAPAWAFTCSVRGCGCGQTQWQFRQIDHVHRDGDNAVITHSVPDLVECHRCERVWATQVNDNPQIELRAAGVWRCECGAFNLVEHEQSTPPEHERDFTNSKLLPKR